MSKKCKVNWSDIDGASPKPKRLHLEKDETDSLFHCPIQECEHDGFHSQRGCRKHVNNKHSWFFYFDEKPNLTEITDSLKLARNVSMVNTIQVVVDTQLLREFAFFIAKDFYELVQMLDDGILKLIVAPQQRKEFLHRTAVLICVFRIHDLLEDFPIVQCIAKFSHGSFNVVHCYDNRRCEAFWDFRWQVAYLYAKHIKLEAGTDERGY